MPPSEESNALHIISDILDKLIDTQQNNAETSANLRAAVQESNVILDDIRTHFTNGFRSEIKTHISKEIKDHVDKTEITSQESSNALADINNKLDKVVDTLTKPWFWVKLIATTVVAIGLIAGAMIKLAEHF